MSAATRPHIVVLGTGLTALTLARSLLTTTPALPIQLTLIDKAKNPGGRLTTRYYDSGVVLETGARVFESPKGEADFAKEVESWEAKGWVREVEQARRKGIMGEGKWWEGVGGVTKGLVEGLLAEVKAAAAGRLSIHYEITAANPTPTNLGSSPLSLSLTPAIEVDPATILVHTAPSPQTRLLLPEEIASAASTTYLKTFALLLPTVDLPDLPVYHRDPHPSLNSIATGLRSTSDAASAGLVIQSTPEKLGLGYTKDESSDEQVRDAFFRVLREANLLPSEVLDKAVKLTGRQSQVKRWKFAQVERAAEQPQAKGDEEPVTVLEGGRLILAGDGTAGGAGGVVGAWRAGERAAELVRQWLKSEQ